MVITQQRLIYTSGTLKFSTDMVQCRRIIAYSDILRRPPSARYQNERSNPPKRFYGYVSVWMGDYVYKTFPLEYDSQIVFFWDNLNLQVYETVLCTALNTSQNVQALGAAMTPPAPIILLPSPVFSFPGCPYTWLKFKLENLCRIQVTCIGEELERCDGIAPTITVPSIPDTTPLYPENRPLEGDPARSLPEEGEQPGDTAVATSTDPDASIPPPVADCTPVRVVVNYTLNGLPGTQTINVLSPVSGVRPDPADAQNLELLCKGDVNGACLPSPAWIRINRGVYPFVNPSIASVVPL